VKKRRQRNVQDRVNHQRKTKKKAEASSELCIPTETTIEQRKMADELKKRQQPQDQR